MKIIKHYEVTIVTQGDYEAGKGARVVGTSGYSSPTGIGEGFLTYETHEGACCGLSLEGVLHYAFVPVIDE